MSNAQIAVLKTLPGINFAACAVSGLRRTVRLAEQRIQLHFVFVGCAVQLKLPENHAQVRHYSYHFRGCHPIQPHL
jgi:hypothetical protein